MTHEWKSTDGKKEVKIQFDGLSKEVINWAFLNKGDLIFNIVLSGRSRIKNPRIYIISEVVYNPLKLLFWSRLMVKSVLRR